MRSYGIKQNDKDVYLRWVYQTTQRKQLEQKSHKDILAQHVVEIDKRPEVQRDVIITYKERESKL